MKAIEVKASFGNITKTVKIIAPHGSGGSYQIEMDKYYQGQAVFTSIGWQAYLNTNSELNSAEDIQVLIDILEKNYLQL